MGFELRLERMFLGRLLPITHHYERVASFHLLIQSKDRQAMRVGWPGAGLTIGDDLRFGSKNPTASMAADSSCSFETVTRSSTLSFPVARANIDRLPSP